MVSQPQKKDVNQYLQTVKAAFSLCVRKESMMGGLVFSVLTTQKGQEHQSPRMASGFFIIRRMDFE